MLSKGQSSESACNHVSLLKPPRSALGLFYEVLVLYLISLLLSDKGVHVEVFGQI